MRAGKEMKAVKKKRAIKTIVFLVIFVLLFLAISALFVSNSANTMSINGLYAEKEETLDVLFVGASSVKTNIIPPLMYKQEGFTSYSLSFDGTSFALLPTLIKEALKTQKPGLILLDLRPVATEITNQKARAVIDNMKMSDNKKEAFDKFASDDNRISLYIPLEKNHSRWKDISSVLGYPYMMLTEPFRYDAFSEFSFKEIYIDKVHYLRGSALNYTHKEMTDHRSFEQLQDKVAIDKDNEKAVYEFAEYCRKNKLNVAFFASTFCYTKSNVEGKTVEKMNYAKELVEKCGFKCYDFMSTEYQNAIGIDKKTDFIDGFHMNADGAYKFSTYFAETLKKDFNLPDHRAKATQKDKEIDKDWQRSVRIVDKSLKSHGIIE